MAKKDFSKLTGNPVYTDIQNVTEEPVVQKTTRKERKTYTKEELDEFRKTCKTQGKKDAGLPRINLAFRQDIFDYITVMARVRGETMTQFVNLILAQYMEENQEIYQKALEFRNLL